MGGEPGLQSRRSCEKAQLAHFDNEDPLRLDTRKRKKYQVSVTALRQMLHFSQGRKQTAGTGRWEAGSAALTAPWPGRPPPGPQCPSCSGPFSAPAGPGWASGLRQPWLQERPRSGRGQSGDGVPPRGRASFPRLWLGPQPETPPRRKRAPQGCPPPREAQAQAQARETAGAVGRFTRPHRTPPARPEGTFGALDGPSQDVVHG